MPHRIVISGLNYAPEAIGIGPYTAGLAEALAARGHQVRVVAGKPYYPHWQTDPTQPGGGWRKSEERGVTITRCPHYVPASPTGLKRMLHLASFALTSAVPLAGSIFRKPDVVIAVVPALFAAIPAWIAARLAGAKFWIHVQDFEVEAAVATGLIRTDSLLARCALRLEASVLRRADRISAISPQMCVRLSAKGIESARIAELRNWADARFTPNPAGSQQLRKDWSLGNRKVLLYSGNIARKQGIELLVDVARLLAHREDLVFVICGEGPNRAALAERAKGLENVVLRDLQPADRMGALLGLATAHLLPQIAEAADLVLPSKLTNMLASGRPVIATAAPQTGLADEVAGCGVVVPPGHAPALAAAIESLIGDPALCAAYGKAAMMRVKQRWEKDNIIDRLITQLDCLVDP